MSTKYNTASPLNGGLNGWAVAPAAIEGPLVVCPVASSNHDVLAAFSPDSLRIVTSCGRQPVKVWDLAGHELFELPGKAYESVDIDTPYVRVAFSPDGNWIFTAGGRAAMLWDGASGAEVLSFNGHTAPISAVAFSPDGRSVATASQDQTAKIWETAFGRELLTLKGHAAEVWSVAFSPDGQRSPQEAWMEPSKSGT